MVETGKFTSVSAVVQHGVELLRARTEDAEMERAALRIRLQRRMEGPFISREEFTARVHRMLERQNAAQSRDSDVDDPA